MEHNAKIITKYGRQDPVYLPPPSQNLAYLSKSVNSPVLPHNTKILRFDMFQTRSCDNVNSTRESRDKNNKKIPVDKHAIKQCKRINSKKNGLKIAKGKDKCVLSDSASTGDEKDKYYEAGDFHDCESNEEMQGNVNSFHSVSNYGKEDSKQVLLKEGATNLVDEKLLKLDSQNMKLVRNDTVLSKICANNEQWVIDNISGERNGYYARSRCNCPCPIPLQHNLKACNSDTDLLDVQEFNNLKTTDMKSTYEIFGKHSVVSSYLNKQVLKKEASNISLDTVLNNMERDMYIQQKLSKVLEKQNINVGGNLIPKYLENLARFNNDHKREETVKHDNANFESLENSLKFVKEHLTTISTDIKDFKQNCMSKMDDKVDKSIFDEQNATIKSRIDHMEQKIMQEQKKLKQEIKNIDKRLKEEEEQNFMSYRNFPYLPVMLFIGAYTLICCGNKK